MIELRITGDDAAAVQQQMIGLLAGTAMNTTTVPSTTEGAKRGRKKAEEPAGNSGADAGSQGAGSSAAGNEGAAPQTTGPVTKETLSPRILQLGQKTGPSAVQELFSEFGASKFSEIPAEQYVALNARLDDLLA